MMALYGRHGESPLPVIAASTPADCFDSAIEAARIAVTLPHAGDPAHRHLPRQLVGAVEDPRAPSRCRRSTRTSPPTPPAIPALPARREPGAPLGDPRHPRRCSTGSAGSRRRTAPATSPTTPANHELMTELRAERRAVARCPTSRWTPGRRRRRCSCSAGARPTARSRARRGGCARGDMRSPPPTCAPRRRCRRTPARWCAPSERVLVPEMNTGQLVKIIRGGVPRRREGYTKVTACRSSPRSSRARSEALVSGNGTTNGC